MDQGRGQGASRVDVLIVGAGPAGSTTARYCACKDLDVLVIDRRKEIGYPVQCGELLPHTEEMYSIFPKGLELEELFSVDPSLVEGESEHVDLVSPGGRSYRVEFRSHILDRRAFDKHLAKLASEAGARVETETSFLRIEDGVVVTSNGRLRPRVLVGADGPNSRVARQSGLENPRWRYPAITCQALGKFEPDVKMFFGRVAPGGYGWIIPKRDGANVGLGFNPELVDLKPSELFRRFVADHSIEYSNLTMGIIPMSGPVSSTVRGNTLLVGDAAGHVMATNGGGIPTAMMAGRVAGRTIMDHLRDGVPLSSYETRWRSFMEKPLRNSLRTRWWADLVLPYDWLLGLTMAFLGRRGLDRAIRCKRLLP